MNGGNIRGREILRYVGGGAISGSSAPKGIEASLFAESDGEEEYGVLRSWKEVAGRGGAGRFVQRSGPNCVSWSTVCSMY